MGNLFHKIWEWVKKHPLLSVMLVGGIILLLMLMGSNSQSQSTSGGAGPTDAEVAAASQLSQTELAAQAQEYNTNAALTAQNNNNATQLAAAQIAANTQDYQVKQQSNVDLAGITAQQNVQEAGIASQVQLADIASKTNIAQINAQVAVAQSQSQTYEDITNAQAETQQHAIDAAAMIETAPYITEADIANSLYSNLGSEGIMAAIQQGAGTKDSFVSLPGLTAYRATNWAPPGATPIASNTSGIIGSISNGLTGLLALA